MIDVNIKNKIEQEIIQESSVFVPLFLESITSLVAGNSPVESERMLRETVLSFGAKLLQRGLECFDVNIRNSLRENGHRGHDGKTCFGKIKGKGRKSTSILSLLGTVEVKQWTACCPECGKWIGSLNELLEVEKSMSAACCSAASLAGVTNPYEQAEHIFKQLTGIQIDDNRIHRAVQSVEYRAENLIDLPLQEGWRKAALPEPGGSVVIMIDGGRIRMREDRQLINPA